VAQLGSALAWGARGRWFESSRPESGCFIMKWVVQEIIRSTVSVVIAGMDSISVIAFTWSHFYPYHALSCWLSIMSVFLLSYFSAYKNTEKIKKLLEERRIENISGIINTVLCCLIALMAFLTKRFAFMLLFPASWGVIGQFSAFLPWIYAGYTLLNALADMERSTKGVSFPRKLSESIDRLLLLDLVDFWIICVLITVSILTCHYKMLAVSISLASLADQYGGFYHWLSCTKRLLHFPILVVGLNNVFRCKDKLKALFFHNSNNIGAKDFICLSVILAASYTQSVSSKLLALAPQNMMPVLMIDRFANYIRQSADSFPCHQTKSTL
jgi:hypothetical protein